MTFQKNVVTADRGWGISITRKQQVYLLGEFWWLQIL